MAGHDSRSVEAIGLTVLSGELWLDSLRTLVDLWAVLLRLEDWDIDVAVVRRKDSPCTDALAYVEHWRQRKSARITLINPIDWSSTDLSGDEIVRVVGHELMHLHFRQAGYAPDENEEAEELLINDLLRSIVALI